MRLLRIIFKHLCVLSEKLRHQLVWRIILVVVIKLHQIGSRVEQLPCLWRLALMLLCVDFSARLRGVSALQVGKKLLLHSKVFPYRFEQFLGLRLLNRSLWDYKRLWQNWLWPDNEHSFVIFEDFKVWVRHSFGYIFQLPWAVLEGWSYELPSWQRIWEALGVVVIVLNNAVESPNVMELHGRKLFWVCSFWLDWRKRHVRIKIFDVEVMNLIFDALAHLLLV